jgi:hypothetical protein
LIWTDDLTEYHNPICKKKEKKEKKEKKRKKKKKKKTGNRK